MLKTTVKVINDDDLLVSTIQECDDVLDHAHALRNELGIGVSRTGSLRRLATIPLALYVEMQRKGIADDPVALKRFLRDRDHSRLRTSGGKV